MPDRWAPWPTPFALCCEALCCGVKGVLAKGRACVGRTWYVWRVKCSSGKSLWDLVKISLECEPGENWGLGHTGQEFGTGRVWAASLTEKRLEPPSK